MIQNILKSTLFAFAALVLTASANLYAQDSSSPSYSGTIKSISTSSRTIKIDSRTFKFNARTRIYVSGDTSSKLRPDDLLPGYPVEYKLSLQEERLLTDLAIITE